MHCLMHCISAGICSTVVMSSDTVLRLVTTALLFGNNKACCQQAKIMLTVTFASNRAPHMALMAIGIHKVCDS